ncbi:hypothetical protein GGR56DRAFT_135789 [Xylariaceae sp. FL0804]|nr:hypothetical protein GGR56DRAFT_135789 [Xylariaceae sp. FL0804]
MIHPRPTTAGITAAALAAASSFAAAAASAPCSSIDVLQAAAANGTSVSPIVSSACGLDAPKVRPVNASSWDWWYFEAVSDDQTHFTAVSFLAAPETGFAPSHFPADAMLATSVALSAPELPDYYIQVLPADRAVVASRGQSASGVWEGTGTRFAGADDVSEYRVDLDVPEIALSGYIILKSTAPAHYASGPARAGESLDFMPGVGWANAIPDSATEVYFNVNGTEVRFTGPGYHDQQWGNSPFNESVASWYWGRGRLGPYSVVWFDGVDLEGAEHVAVYVARDDEIVYAAKSGVIVRPTGGDATYPPRRGDIPDGYRASIDMGGAGVLEFNVTHTQPPTLTEDTHVNWRGVLSGYLITSEGRRALNGTASYEQFMLVEA